MTILIFIVILSVLILVHEFGHLLLAKAVGARVDEFGLGFPPRLWSFRRGETTYAVNLLPFGGYVKIFGENPSQSVDAGAPPVNHFTSKPAWAQALVLVGGVAFNWLLAWLVLVLGFATFGLPTTIEKERPTFGQIIGEEVVILSVLPESPAARLGLAPEDRIISLADDQYFVSRPSVEEIQEFVAARAGREITLEYERAGERRRAPLTPVLGLAEEQSRAVIGISLAPAGRWQMPLPYAVVEGTRSAWSMTALTARGFADLGQRIVGRVMGDEEAGPVLAAVTGPVGLAGLVGRASDLGLSYLFLLTALISINLAFLNLLPFPALDGGRLLFLLIETARGRPLKPALANTLNVAGFALLILLMIIITIADIAKL